jgi:ABC-type Fe3+/spermidine/putrescine transport system ATPase subunit
VPAKEVEERIAQSLAHVRLQGYRARYPHELSGGQQQRVAIARALAMRPALLLLDEPMSNLDARLRAEMRVELAELLRRLGMTAVAVTHNQEEALAMSDRIVVMAEGGIRQVGTPGEVYLRPADAFVANFVGDANVLDASHVGFTDGGRSLFRMSAGDPIVVAGDPEHCRRASRLLLRPESISLCADGAVPAEGANRFRGKVVSTAYMGAFTELRTRVGDQEILVKVPAGAAMREMPVGGDVMLQCDPSSVRALAP